MAGINRSFCIGAPTNGYQPSLALVLGRQRHAGTRSAVNHWCRVNLNAQHPEKLR